MSFFALILFKRLKALCDDSNKKEKTHSRYQNRNLIELTHVGHINVKIQVV